MTIRQVGTVTFSQQLTCECGCVFEFDDEDVVETTIIETGGFAHGPGYGVGDSNTISKQQAKCPKCWRQLNIEHADQIRHFTPIEGE